MARQGRMRISEKPFMAMLGFPEDTLLIEVQLIDNANALEVEIRFNHKALPIIQISDPIPIVKPVFKPNPYFKKQFKHWELKT